MTCKTQTDFRRACRTHTFTSFHLYSSRCLCCISVDLKSMDETHKSYLIPSQMIFCQLSADLACVCAWAHALQVNMRKIVCRAKRNANWLHSDVDIKLTPSALSCFTESKRMEFSWNFIEFIDLHAWIDTFNRWLVSAANFSLCVCLAHSGVSSKVVFEMVLNSIWFDLIWFNFQYNI